jgi:ferric-dicitrate binding protein FerR (iron transport regulator)
MPAALAEVKAEWRQFRDDKPGERFCNHRKRMQRKSRKHAAVALALGVLLLAGGVALLFIPGPGLPLIVFGLALVASHSNRLSNLLDRTEPRVRARGRDARSWWRRRSHAERVADVGSTLAIVAVGLMPIWKWVVVAYLL